MADISKITLPNGGGTYDLKDSESRELIGQKYSKPTGGIPVSDLASDAKMSVLSYGSSTWADFLSAYATNTVVYCRASTNSNPATGSQTRLAFLAYVNNATNPTSAEFQYYRSVSSHSADQQGDQVYIYTLSSNGTWSVTVRSTFTKIAAGTGLESSYSSSNGTLTLNSSIDPAVATPSMDGTGAVGTSTKYAREDHCHPTDTSRAPTAHASSATTYGSGTSENYGHVKLSDSISSTSNAADGMAATPFAVKKAYDLAYETNQLITPFVSSKIRNWDPATNGKIIFIGNSYSKLDNTPEGARPSSDTSFNYWKWPEFTAKSLGLEDHISDSFEFYPESSDWTWWNIGRPYHSLAHGSAGYSFIEDLTDWVSNHSSQLENIGAIVLVAGINDSRGDTVEGETGPRSAQVPAKLQELASYIKDPVSGYPNGRFPNAVLYNGYTGWINESNQDAAGDPRSYEYRQIVANYYMEGRYCGWNYLNGIENVFHDKKMFQDYIHPNEKGEKRLGIAIANALITGSCDVAYRNLISGNSPASGGDPFTAGVVGYSDNANYTITQVNSNAFIEESIQGNTNKMHYDSFEITISPARTLNVNSSYSIVTAPIRFANACDMGNQIFEIKDNNDAGFFMVARPYIQRSSGLIRLQIKGFSDGSSSKKVSKIERFICDTTNHLLND